MRLMQRVVAMCPALAPATAPALLPQVQNPMRCAHDGEPLRVVLKLQWSLGLQLDDLGAGRWGSHACATSALRRRSSHAHLQEVAPWEALVERQEARGAAIRVVHLGAVLGGRDEEGGLRRGVQERAGHRALAGEEVHRRTAYNTNNVE